MSKILIGCDPEVFVRNPNSLQFQCAHNMIPGTKEKPFKVPHGAVQVDGMALEFNIDPASTEDEFVKNVQAVYHELGRMVPGYQLACVPTADFDNETFANAPEEAKILGCEPDYSAYSGLPNPRPNGNVQFRTASGHIHIGWTEGKDPMSQSHFEDCRILVRELDYTLGVMSMYFDKDKRRRELYGQAGAFRPKSYGVEYRVLSNAWLTDERLMRWVYQTVLRTIKYMDEGKSIYNSWPDWHWAENCLAGRDYYDHTTLNIDHVNRFYLNQEGVVKPPSIDTRAKKAA